MAQVIVPEPREHSSGSAHTPLGTPGLQEALAGWWVSHAVRTEVEHSVRTRIGDVPDTPEVRAHVTAAVEALLVRAAEAGQASRRGRR